MTTSHASVALHGVRDVLPAGSYAPQAASTPQQIGAPALWGPTLDTAGQGVKIGIIDSGIDPEHPYFDPGGIHDAAGLSQGSAAIHDREGDRRSIVRRRRRRRGAKRTACVHEDDDAHGTHVAGIAAGNADTPADGRRISGVAPRAYIGNYKVFVETDDGPEPQCQLTRHRRSDRGRRRRRHGRHQLLRRGARDRAEPRHRRARSRRGGGGWRGTGDRGRQRLQRLRRRVGVLPCQVASDAISRRRGRDQRDHEEEHAAFSSVGPTTISLRLKPDVAAPGVSVLSSVPGAAGPRSRGRAWRLHTLRAQRLFCVERHPAWTVEQLKSALVQTGVDSVDGRRLRAGPRFQGGGVVALTTSRSSAPLRQADRALVRPHGTRDNRKFCRASRGRRRRSGHVARDERRSGCAERRASRRLEDV